MQMSRCFKVRRSKQINSLTTKGKTIAWTLQSQCDEEANLTKSSDLQKGPLPRSLSERCEI